MSVLLALSYSIGAVAADGSKPMDQFRITAIPAGIELSPRSANVTERKITYDSAKFAPPDIEEFARTLCWGSNAKIEFQSRSLFQKLRGKAHATLICEG